MNKIFMILMSFSKLIPNSNQVTFENINSIKNLKKIVLIFLTLIVTLSGCNSKTEDEQLTAPATDPTPAISFSPTSGSVGTIMTITSSNTDLINPSAVTIGGVNAIILKSTTTSVTVLSLSSIDGQVVLTPATGNPITSSSNFTFVESSPLVNQQGSKLVGTGSTTNAAQGFSVAISANGDTVLVGGIQDNSNQGAAWIFTRSSGTWTQQGIKLLGSGNVGAANQGYSVALSADGDTALIGGPNDNASQGAAWIFVRSSGSWTQQGSKLVGTGNTGAANQGYSVALSADGNTALIGGPNDNSNRGAAWVFNRSSGAWTQQGSKLVGAGGILTNSRIGYAVALSADGNTAILGAYGNSSNQGAAWVFTRSSGVWSQQGSKLVGTGNTGAANQGCSVALSADGNTALIGGLADSTSQGAAWVFTRSSGVWSQQGSKLVGTGNTGAANQGNSVALSADGNTAIVGGNNDNSGAGALWVFNRSSGVWSQQGSKLVGNGVTSGAARQASSIAISADGKTAVSGGYLDDSVKGAAWIFVP